MAEDEPKIEDPFRRQRQLPPKPPLRRLSGEVKAATPPPDGDKRLSGQVKAAGASRDIPLAPQPAEQPSPSRNRTVPQPTFQDRAISAERPRATETSRPKAAGRKRASSSRGKHAGAPASNRKTGQSVLFGVLSLALVAYAFNIANLQIWLESALQGSSDNASAHSSIWSSLLPLVPWIVLAPALALFYFVLNSLAIIIGLKKRRQRRNKRPGSRKNPLDHFKTLAGTEDVRPEFAYRCFTLLQPLIPADQPLTPYQTLEDDLHLQPARIREVYIELLRLTDRDFDPYGKLPNLRTVLEMMLTAQSLPRRKPANLQPVFVPGDPGRRR